MTAWQSDEASQNPYTRTAFRITRVARETTQHRRLVQQIGATRRIMRAAPDAHVVAGLPVAEAELNDAEHALLSARDRLWEELRHHAAEPPRAEMLQPVLDQVREAVRQIAEAGADEAPRLAFLREWTESLSRQVLETPPAPWLGRAELAPVPPFGPLEDE